MTETQVSTKLRVALASLGAVCWKVSDRFHASRPDLFLAYQANTTFIEMKLWPEEPTPLQRDTLNELSAVGIETFVGKYDRKLKVLYIIDWITQEKMSFLSILEGAEWLLRRDS